MYLDMTVENGKSVYEIRIDADVQNGTVGDKDADFLVIESWKIDEVKRNGRPVDFHSLRERLQDYILEHIEKFVERDAIKQVDDQAEMQRAFSKRRGGEYE